MLLHDHLARAAEARPDALALTMGDEHLSYGQVAALSDSLAAALVANGVEPGDRVGLLVPKQPAAIVAMHAVLKAGAAYVPLDADSPAPRLARIVAKQTCACCSRCPGPATRLDELAAVMDLPLVASVDHEGVAGADGELRSAFSRADWDVPAARPAAGWTTTRRPTCCSPPGRPATPRAWSSPTATWRRSSTGPSPSSAPAPPTASPAIRRCTSTCRPSTSTARSPPAAELHLVPAQLSLNPRGWCASSATTS